MWITGRPVSRDVGGRHVDHRPPGEQRPWEVNVWITGRERWRCGSQAAR